MTARDPDEYDKQQLAIGSFFIWHLVTFLSGSFVAVMFSGESPVIGGVIVMTLYSVVDRIWTYKETGTIFSLELYRRDIADDK